MPQSDSPNCYLENPTDEIDVIKKQVFEAEVLCNYMAPECGLNQLALYQLDVVRKLMQVRMLELKS